MSKEAKKWLSQYDDYDSLWSSEDSPFRSPEEMLQAYADKVRAEDRKKDCLDFFYWWYNQKGSNTEQGYDEWLKEQLKTK